MQKKKTMANLREKALNDERVSGEKNSEETREVSGTRTLYRTTKNLREIFNDPLVKCQLCEEEFDPLFIFNHIGKKEECRSFYGPDFERLKKEKYKIRMNVYRNEKNRETYKSNPDLQDKKKEASKKSYLALKEKNDLRKKEEKRKFRLESKKSTLSYEIKFARERNSMGRKRFLWVEKCIPHFFEKFGQMNDNIKMKLMDLEKSIIQVYEKNEETIEEKAEGGKDEETLMQYAYVYLSKSIFLFHL